MKKLLYIIAGLLLVSAVSCVKDEQATFDPSKATAPVLGSYDVTEKAITASYTPAIFKLGFNEKMAPYHSLVIASLDGKPVNKVLPATANNGNAKITGTALSKVLVGMGCSYGQKVDLELAIRASMQDPARTNGRNGYVDSKDRIAVKGFEVTEAAGNPFEGFTQASTWGVIGKIASLGMDWNADIAMISDGTWHVAKSVVLATTDQFKFRKDGGWDTNLGATGDAEPYVVSLDSEIEAAAGGKNLAVPADGTYDLWVNPGANLYKVTEAYNPYPDFNRESTWGLIGSLTEYGIDWNGDLAATTNGADAHLVQGVILKKDNAFKFRKDQGWDINMGAAGDVEPFVVALDAATPALQGGKNLAVPEDGIYDILLDHAAGTITVVATLGGPASKKAGGTPEEPGKPEVWSLVGTIGGSNWDADTDLSNAGGALWIVRNVSLTASDEFKIRADHKWDEAYGGPEENAQSTIDPANAYGVYKPTIGTAFEAKDKNIAVGVAGKFDVTFDYAAKTILVEEHKEFPEHLYMIGDEFGGWQWADAGVVEMTPVLHNPDWGANAPGQFWTVRYISAGKGFKFNSKKEWGGDFWGLKTNDGFTEASGNCTVATGGFYMIHVDLKREMVHVEPARIYGMGDCFGGWEAEKGSALFEADGKTIKATLAADGELRMFVASKIATSDWWTREFIILDGKIAYRGNGGDQQRVPCTAGQVVTLDPNAGTGTIQ